MIKFYPKPTFPEQGFTAEEIRKNIHFLYADYECPNCGKVQPVAAGKICLKYRRKHD